MAFVFARVDAAKIDQSYNAYDEHKLLTSMCVVNSVRRFSFVRLSKVEQDVEEQEEPDRRR